MTGSVHAAESQLFTTLVQLIVMIGAARIGNTLLRRVGQPGVVGEIIAGLLLGPTLFGHYFPGTAQRLFAAQASPPIAIISQIGLIFLMFQIGMDFDFAHLGRGRNARAVISVTAASMLVPFAAGVLFGRLSAAALAPGIDPTVYSLFCGVGLAITAVPILGRILGEYGLTRTAVGVVAISAAALNDVIGWVMLAAVSALAVASFSALHLTLQIVGLALLVLALRFLGRPLVRQLLRAMPPREGAVPVNLMALVICLMFLCALCTYQLGIFAIFGGFAAGLLFHHHPDFAGAWRRQVGRFVLVFFLPVFFTLTGLRTNVLGLGSDGLGWLALLLALAVFGKVLPVYTAGRLCGFDGPHAWILGALMNTRALMELIVLNIGLDLGFIPPRVFTLLVIMAIVTTLMTGPMLKVLLPRIGHGIPRGTET